MQTQCFLYNSIEMRKVDESLEIQDIHIFKLFVNLISVLWVFAELAEYGN